MPFGWGARFRCPSLRNPPVCASRSGIQYGSGHNVGHPKFRMIVFRRPIRRWIDLKLWVSAPECEPDPNIHRKTSNMGIYMSVALVLA